MFRKPNVGSYQAVYVYQGFLNTSDCGHSAAATCVNQSRKARFIGKEQCRALHPTPAWWRAIHIMSALQTYGVACTKQTFSVKRTAGIYLVRQGWWSHWVIAWTVRPNQVTVLDPMHGLYTLSLRNFLNRQRSSSVIQTNIVF